MKTLRMIGMVIMTILMSVGFTSCSSDDDEKTSETTSIVGSWTTPYANFGDTTVFEFKSNGSVSEYNYKQSVMTYEEHGTYVFANGKLTANLERRRKMQENGEWGEWINEPYTTVFDNAYIKGNKLYLSNETVSLVMDRK